LPPFAILFATAAAGSALAAAPEPVRPVAPDLYSGRWYEVARTPNARQADCARDTIDFAGRVTGKLSVVQTCNKTAGGSPATYKASATVLPNNANAKIKLNFFGGFITQEYWIVDHADDGAWAIMATPAGHYVWLLSRRPELAPQTRVQAVARLKALGFNTANLRYDQAPQTASAARGAGPASAARETLADEGSYHHGPR